MLRLLGAVLLAWSAVSTAASLSSKSGMERRSISQDLMDQFIRFTKMSFAADQLYGCDSPLGTTLIKSLNNQITSTRGFVARDDTKKEIIIAFMGTVRLQDWITDVNIPLLPLSSQGVNKTNHARVHLGFLTAYNSVASDVLSSVSSELQKYPDYTLISTGHSLGGALASLAGVSLAANFPDAPLQVFTFGQPRTGDAAYADLVEELIGSENLFRAVHTSDGVPTLLPQILGYRHHQTEFWNFQDPSTSIANVKECSGQEDPTCSDSIPSGGINYAHYTYFGENVWDISSNSASDICS